MANVTDTTPKPRIKRRPLNNAGIKRHKKRRRMLVGLVVTFVLFLVFLGGAWYQPLTPVMDGYFATRVVTSSGVVAKNFASPGPSSHTVWVEPTGTFTIQVILTVDNNGPFPIRVDSVTSWGKGSHTYFDTFAKEGFQGGKPLTPFIVTGQWERTVLVEYQQHCTTSSNSRIVVVKGLPTTFSFFFFRHTVPEQIAPLYLRLRKTC